MGNKRKSNDNIVLNINGIRCSDPNLISNCCNDYFTSIADNIHRTIPVSNKSYLDFMGPQVPESFFVLPSSPSEVYNVVSSFKTKGGNIDSIPIYIYKYLNHLISPVISEIFNSSIVQRVFPTCLKKGRVIPVFKAGIRDSCSNFRPISTLPVVSKS